MAAARLDIIIEQGATFRRILKFKDNNGNLQDMTGYVFNGQVRKTAGDPNLLASFTCTVLNQISNLGEVEIKLTATNSSAIPVPKSKTAEKTSIDYCYDIERLAPNAIDKVRIIEGTATVTPEVSL